MAQVLSPESKDRRHDVSDWMRLTKLKKPHVKSGKAKKGRKDETAK